MKSSRCGVLRAGLVRLSVCIVLACTLSAPVRAQQDVAAEQTARVLWSALDADQKAALAPLQGQWDTLEARQQQRMLRLAARWRDASPAQRDKLSHWLGRWAVMSPDQRTEPTCRTSCARRSTAR